jgi:predicted DNA-binding protein (MmcQ/YjbR family)
MNIEELRWYALSKKNAEECFPFDENTLVFKVNNKIFLLVSLSTQPFQFNAKCGPEKAIEWRASYDCVIPGFHMNKMHWNTVILDGTLSNNQVQEMIDDSYDLAAKTKK